MNNTADYRGGALSLTDSTVLLNDCWLLLNEASGLFAKGGAIAGSNSDISLTYCSFDFNRVTLEQGGPLVNPGDVVSYYGGGAETQSLVMRSRSGTVRWIDAIHNFERLDKIRYE